MSENKINIAEILKNKPKGTKLYSPIFGEVAFDEIYTELDVDFIFVKNKVGNIVSFEKDGKYDVNGQQMLFPGEDMHNWFKFAWKKGDVLQSNDHKKEVIFDGFVTSNYTCFKGKHFLDCTDENNHKYKEEIQLFTASYNIEEDDAAQCYINTIEKKLGGKLNLGTLEIWKKPKWTPKPFDKVVVRSDNPLCVWYADIFSHVDRETLSYVCVGDSWTKCLPYNEETAKLIGTTKSLED